MRFKYGLILVFFIACLAGGAWAQDTRENADYKLAMGLFNDKLYAQAEDQLKSFIEKYPSTALGAEARFTLGLVQVKLKKWGDARATFQDFPSRFPEHAKAPDALWNLGDVFIAERRWADAGSAYARLKTFFPRNRRAPEALLAASRQFVKAGDMTNARLVLNAIILEYPQSDLVMEANYSLGILSIEAGESDRALGELTRVLNQSALPLMKARATVAIGRAHAQLGNPSEAERRYRDVMTTYVKTDAVYEASLRLADLQREQRRFTDAAIGYDALIQNAAAPPAIRTEASAGAAENAFAAGDYAASARLYATVITSLPADTDPDPELLTRAARAARKAGDHPTAARWLERLAADTLAGVDRRRVLAELADNAREAGNPALAARYFQEYVDRYPDNAGAPFALLRLAMVMELDVRNYPRAIELYSLLSARYGASPVADRAQFGYGRCLEAIGKFGEAAVAYELVSARFPGSALADEAARKARDLRRFKPGDAGSALPALVATMAAMREASSSAAVDVALGRLYLEHLKDYPAAARAFDNALSHGAREADADWAAFGKAMAALRIVQLDAGNSAAAERELESFVSGRPPGPLRDEAAFELYLQRSEGKPAPAQLDAAAKFLAATPRLHENEVKLAFAFALQKSGRDADAVKEFDAVLATAQQDGPVVEAHYGRGLARAAMKKFSEAIEDFRAYGKKAPGARFDADALYALGSTLSRTGLYADAAQAFELLVLKYPYAPLADSAAIAALYAWADAGQTGRAVTGSAELLLKAEANPFADAASIEERMYACAVLLARAKNASASKAMLARYIANYPTGRHTGDAYFALGQMAKDEGKMTLATTYLQKASALSTGSQARKDAADLLLSEGRNEEAVKEYEQLANTAASRLEKTYALSRAIVALYRAGRETDARAKSTEFSTAYPDATSLFDEFELERGKMLFKAKRMDDALDVFEEAEDSDTPEISAAGLYWQGKVQEAAGKNEKAIGLFAQVLKKHATTAAAIDASLALARMALRAEQWDAAAQHFKTVAEAPDIRQASLKEALDGLILCYEQTKTYDAAAEMTKRYLALWPGDPSAFEKRIQLGEFYYQLGYFSQAITHFENLLSEAPIDEQAVIRYSIGDCYYFKGDFTQAALEYLKVPYLVVRKTEIDWTATAYDAAARSYVKLEKFDLAKDLWQKIIDTPGLDPRFKGEAQKKIESLNNR